MPTNMGHDKRMLSFCHSLPNLTSILPIFHRFYQTNAKIDGPYRRHLFCSCSDSGNRGGDPSLLLGNKMWLSSFDRDGDDNNVGGTSMNLLKRLWLEEDGQSMTEYTLVTVLVALVIWLGVRDTNIGNSLASGWSNVVDCVSSPSSCIP